MWGRWVQGARHWILLPQLELLLVLVTVLFAAFFGLSALALTSHALLGAMALLLVSVLVFNLGLMVLQWRQVPPTIIVWAMRLGNLVFLTIGIYLTGSFASPIFPLYAIYLVIGSLGYGWRGAMRNLGLCGLSWAGLALLDLPAGSGSASRVAILLSTFVVLALVLGVLATRYVHLWQGALQRSREMAFLQEVSRSLGASLDPEEVLAKTLSQVNELLDVEAASLALVDPEMGWITFEWAIGGGNDDIKGLRLEPGQGIVGQVIQSGESMLVPDVSADPRWYQGVDQTSGFQTRSLICVPLCTKGQIIGALEVLNKRDGPFTEQDRRLLTSLAGLAAQYIENARLHDQIRRHVLALEEAYQEVYRLDELKSAFIRNMSHELRTPLALIEGYVEILLDGQLGTLRPEQREGLCVVAERATHLNRMVNDIISLQSVGDMGFDLEVICLASLTRTVADGLRSRVDKAGIRLDLDLICSEERLMVRGDPFRLGQALDHLIDNAIKFSPNGGTVSLNLGRQAEMVYLCVRDEGIGVPQEELERVFDLFYQVDGSSTRSWGGLGLGLTLVKRVIEAHGGRVWVESSGVPGQGSAFTFYLPAHDGAAEILAQEQEDLK